MADGGLISSLKEQSKAILIMMSVAIVSVLAMIVLNIFTNVTQGLADLGNGTGTSANVTITDTLALFSTAFALTGSFASIGVLVIIVKGIIGVVRGLN